MIDLRTFLRNLPAFERFKGRQLDVLVDQLRLETYDPGHCFVTQDQQAAAVYMILDGVVDAVRRDAVGGDDEPETREVRDGELFGLLALVDDMPAMETYTARGKVCAATLTPERYRALFLLAPAVAHQLQYMVAVQLARKLQQQNKSLRKGLRGKPASLLERLFGA